MGDDDYDGYGFLLIFKFFFSSFRVIVSVVEVVIDIIGIGEIEGERDVGFGYDGG